MHLPMRLALLHRSDNQIRRETQQNSHPKSIFIFIGISAGTLLFLVVALLSYKFVTGRRRRNKDLPLSHSWQFWIRRNKSYGQLATHDRSQSLSTINPAPSTDTTARDEESAARSAVEAGVDRNTSVRSVMTLPAYSQAPQASEQVIGREGERAGMDTVVEFPETIHDEEARREDEMESLYQIRLARRREISDRERRRQERREAREREDWDTLEQLRVESRLRAVAASNGSNPDLSAAAMLAEHQSRGRERRVSSVSYADVGHVRHDGSRLRANSQESERGGLLDGAAPMGENQGQGHGHTRIASGSSSIFSLLPRPHLRNRSASSMSISTAASELENVQPPLITPPSAHTGDRSSSRRRSPYGTDVGGNGTSESSPVAPRFTPEVSSGSDDIGESHIPPPFGPGSDPSVVVQPPSYDAGWGDAPAYRPPAGERSITAASSFRNERVDLPGGSPRSRGDGLPMRIPSKAPILPQIQTLPSINVEGATEPNTPASPVRRLGSSAAAST